MENRTYLTPCGEYYNLYMEILKQPHTMIAGKTGSGKSVIINGLIYTATYWLPCEQPIDSPNRDKVAQFILIDPKRVELSMYAELPHTIAHATEPDEYIPALRKAMDIVDSRNRDMAARRIRKYDGGHVYVIIDEFADLMTTNKREIKPLVQRLTQIGRSARVHVMLATQCPLREFIPTEIKCNFDAVIGLRTRSRQDSRNILGSIEINGEKVGGLCYDLPDPLTTGIGKCLFLRPEGLTCEPFHMYSDEELATRVEYWRAQVSGIRSPLLEYVTRKRQNRA